MWLKRYLQLPHLHIWADGLVLGWTGEGCRSLRPQGGNRAPPGVLKGLAPHWAPPLAVGFPFPGPWHFRAQVLLRE